LIYKNETRERTYATEPVASSHGAISDLSGRGWPYQEGELQPEATIQKFLTVRAEGDCLIRRMAKFRMRWRSSGLKVNTNNIIDIKSIKKPARAVTLTSLPGD